MQSITVLFDIVKIPDFLLFIMAFLSTVRIDLPLLNVIGIATKFTTMHNEFLLSIKRFPLNRW